MEPHDDLVGCRAACAAVTAADAVAVTGGRHAGTLGVLSRAAAPHQGHHIVRLAGGSDARISMAYIHRADCPIAAS